jgi:class 3 adenylate cyclase
MPALNLLPVTRTGLPVPGATTALPRSTAVSAAAKDKRNTNGPVLRTLIAGRPKSDTWVEGDQTMRDPVHFRVDFGTGVVGRPWDLIGRAPGGRKLVVVVYADMVGYSRLIELDDAGTLERLKTLRRTLIDPVINEHGGWICQTGGDSLLSVFDSISGAVRCAVTVQQRVPRHNDGLPPDRAILFRIGINIGDVIADGTDLHGDAVNVAARLEAACPPGAICVSRAVRDHVHGHLDLAFEDLGVLALKNIARPIEGFVVSCPGPWILAHA